MASLSFVQVRKDFGKVRALRDFTLSVADGEFVVLVGPSGCGKSTVLRVAAGLERPTSGAVRIGVDDVTEVPPAKRNVAMVFQSYALFPHLSVAENIGFGLSARKVAPDRIERQVAEAARMIGCEQVLDRKPYQLSGGERQRVALARALVRHPDVYLLDEPLSNLDAQLRVSMRAELQGLHQRLGATMVYVTHDQVEALTMGDRVAVLREGVLQQVGTPDGVYRRPANRFVATFVGSPAMNILPAELQSEGLRAGPFLLKPPMGAGGLLGKRLELGIRPEHVRLSSDGDGVRAEVQVVEAAGPDTFLHLDAAGHRVVARVGPGLRPTVGSGLWIGFARKDAHLFDRDSGEVLVQPG
jgi:multiple sugar transport system ATP-binding protein